MRGVVYYTSGRRYLTPRQLSGVCVWMWGICITEPCHFRLAFVMRRDNFSGVPDSDVEVGGGNSFNDPVVVVILRWYVKIM